MDYRPVFDVQSQTYPWWFPASGLAGALLFLSCRLVLKRLPPGTPGSWNAKARAVAGSLFLLSSGLSLAWTVLALAMTWPAYRRAWAARSSGADQLVEHVVDAVEPMGKQERVVVGDRTFTLSEFSLRPGYNVTTRQGGVLRKGARVRIHHLDEQILQLEVAR